MLTFLLFTNLASLVGVVAMGYALYRHIHPTQRAIQAQIEKTVNAFAASQMKA